MTELLFKMYIAGVISGVLLNSAVVILVCLIKWKWEDVFDGRN